MFNESDKVVCVNDRFGVEALAVFSSLPKRGKIYVVRSVHDDRHGVGLCLVGIVGEMHPTKNVEVRFRPERFRRLSDIRAENAAKRAEVCRA